VISSSVVGYDNTSTTYRIYILARWETMVSKDVKCYEDVRSSSSHDSFLVIEENEETIFPKTNSDT